MNVVTWPKMATFTPVAGRIAVAGRHYWADVITPYPHRRVLTSKGDRLTRQLKRKIVFALSMGLVTTGIVSFVLIAIHLGFSDRFAWVWLRSWGVGYVIAIPAILVIGPWLQVRIDRLMP